MKLIRTWLVLGVLLLSGTTGWAQPQGGGDQGMRGQRGGGRGGQGGPGGMMGGQGGMMGGPGGMMGGPGGMMGGRGGMMGGPGGIMGVRQYDTNGDMIISEDELAEGLQTLQRRVQKLHPFVLEEFDANTDGQLDEDESRNVQEFFASLAGALPHDENGDWLLSEEELDAAWEALSGTCTQYNQMVISRFDADGDGAISEEEAEAAKKQMTERRGGGARPGGFGPRRPRGGAEGADGGRLSLGLGGDAV